MKCHTDVKTEGRATVCASLVVYGKAGVQPDWRTLRKVSCQHGKCFWFLYLNKRFFCMNDACRFEF